MSSFKHTFRRVMSVVLSCAMLCGFIGMFSLVSFAADVRTVAQSNSADLTFVVPDSIYLTPDGLSWKNSSSTPFQYYLNNTSAGVKSGTYSKTGYIYYKFTGQSGNATLSYSFLNSSFSSLSGGSVTLSNDTFTSGSSLQTVTINGGSSPSLSNTTTGCYIQWVLNYTDSADGVAKKAYAYTYVYKPYTVPFGGYCKGQDTDGVDHYGAQVSWVSGAHSIDTSGTYHDGNGFYSYYANGKGLAGYASADAEAYYGSTSATGVIKGVSVNASGDDNQQWYSGAARWYSLFADTASNDTIPHLDTNVDNVDYNSISDNSFGSTSSGNRTYNVKNFDFWYHEHDPSSCFLSNNLVCAPVGNITIDSSRFSNLNQIPGLSVTLLITSDKASKYSSWFVADASGITSWRSTDYWQGNKDDSQNLWNSRNYVIAGQGANDMSGGTKEAFIDEGVAYAGPWVRSLLGDSDTQGATYTYSVRTCHNSEEDSSGTNERVISHVVMDLKATYYNKTNLRTAVFNAIKKFPALGVTGISSGNITSKYFDANDNYKWTTFRNAFKAAVLALGKVDGTITNPDTLATNLNDALTGLHTKVTLNANGGDLNDAKVAGSSGSGYVQIGANQTVSVQPTGTPTRNGYTFNNWSLTANPATGTQGSTTVTVGYNNTLYACWTADQYTITCNAAGGTNAEDNPTSYDIEHSATLKAPTREGYTFKGWTGDNGSTPQTSVTIPEGSTGNKSYTANWEANKYTVVYAKGPDSATGTMNSFEATYDSSFTVAANGFANEGHTFTGWKGSNNQTYQPGDTPKNLTSEAGGTFTMTAQWSANSYNVVYDNMLDMQAWQQSVGNGNQISITNKTDTGFTATSTGGTDGYTNWSPAMEVEAGKQYVVETNMTGSGYQVFADWLNSSGIHFQYSNTNDTATSTFTAPANAVYMRIRFDANVNGNTITCSNVRVAKVDDNALLNRSNVSVSPSNKIYTYGTDYQAELPTPTRTGYTFAGWYTDYSAETAVASGATVPAHTLHLWSKWNQETYNISYSMDGGTNHEDNPATYTVEDEITLKAPSKQGHTFTGWTGSNGTTPETSVTISKGSTGNKNFTAHWDINSYTIRFDCDNGSDIIENTVVYNNPVNKPANPSKDSTAQYSYTFTGWKSSVTGRVFGPNDTLPAANADVTYTAQYDATTRTYNVYWQNSDGTPLETDSNVPYGTTPVYNGADPSKAPDEQYQYTWTGWESGGQTYLKTDTLPAIQGETTFKAAYSTTTRQYTITWYDWDRTTVLDTQTRDHGTGVTYAGINPPVREGNAEYSYAFDTFKDSNGNTYPKDNAITLNGDMTLYASYTQSINTYTVTWVGATGNLEVDNDVPYGTAPSFDLNGGANPTKEETEAATYEFIGWKSSITEETYATVDLLPTVTGNVTFTAQFEAHIRQYNISWKNWNGDALGANLLNYGSVPAFSGETPIKTPTTTKEYVFAGWRSSGGTEYPAGTALPAVTGTETYTAYYTEQARLYSVTWIDEEGNVLEFDEKAYTYNAHPTYDRPDSSIPGKTANVEYTYTWGGWRDTVSGSSYTPSSLVAARVTKDTTYQVWYRAIKNQYEVTWIFKDSTGADTSDATQVDYGANPTHADPDRYIEYEGETPYYYTFNGWNTFSPTDTLPPVTGPITYTAKYVRADHVHQYDEGTMETEPTCEGTGTKIYRCTHEGCGMSYTETVQAAGHIWDNGTVDNAPTCIATGTMLYRCTRSGCTATKEEVIAKDMVNGHDWEKDEELSTEPSCEYTGTYYYKCNNNENHTKREIIPALGHHYSNNTVLPTCVAQGYTEHVCSLCGHSYRDAYTDAPGHNYDANEDGIVNEDDAVKVREPDCINTGILRYECQVCHTTRDEFTPVLETHNYIGTVTREATCTLGEKTTYECSVCHKSYSEDSADALGHNYDRNEDGVETEADYDTIPATCTERGSVSKTCTRCGKTVRVENLPALRHDWGEGEVTQPATCAADGVRTYTCSRCNITRTEAIPMTPDAHTYDGGVVTTPPTYSRTGLMTYTCTTCGHSYTEEIGRLERDEDDPSHGDTGDTGNSGGDSTHHSSEGRCSMCDKYEAIQSSNSPGITKLFYSIVHFIVHLFATFSF